MNKYTVTFTQYWSYEVEAPNEDDAFDKAEELFERDMHQAVAHTWWDESEVECVEHGDEDEDSDDEDE